MKIETKFGTIIQFTLDDGRVVEMKLCGREQRTSVLGMKGYEEQQKVNKKDVEDVCNALNAR
jgi:dihydrodipicolinate reductase